MTGRSGRALRRWLLVAALILAIYAFVPVALPAWEGYRRLVGARGDALALVGLAIAAALVAGSVARRPSWPGPITWLALAATVAGYAATLSLVRLTPAEKTHFLSYGLLAWAAHRAFRVRLGDWTTAVATVVLVALVGWGDELIQRALPNRYFEWKDVALNAGSGLLATIPVSVLHGNDAATATTEPGGNDEPEA